jgi:hypothetical protein
VEKKENQSDCEINMKTNKQIQKNLKEESKRRLRNSIELLFEGKITKVKENLEWINLSKEVINQEKSRMRYYWALIVGAIFILLLGISYTLPVRKTNVSIELAVDGVRFSLKDKWQSKNIFTANSFFVDHLINTSSDFEPDFYTSSEPFSMSLNGRDIELTNLHLDKDSEMELQAQKNQLKIYVRNTQFSGTFSIRKGEIVIDGKKLNLDLDSDLPPSNYEFETNLISKTSDPCLLDLQKNISWEFTELIVNSMQFSEEFPPGSGKTISTIKSGEIFLHEANAQLTLRENERLEIDISKQCRLKLEGEKDLIKITFEGKVSRLHGGPEGIEKNLKPTYLDYIYNHQRLAFFWSAIVFIIGFLWSIRNTLFRK